MTNTPSPFFNFDDLGDTTDAMKIRSKSVEKMAVAFLVKAGEDYLRNFGEEKVKADIQRLRVEMQTWNSITGSTLTVSLQTVDTILQNMACLPFQIQQPQIAMNKKFAERNAMLSAIRNHLKKEIANRVTNSRPDLSTPPSDKPPTNGII